MQFTTSILAAVAVFTAAASAANVVHFVNQDSTTRTIYFTPNNGGAAVNALTIAGGATEPQTFPDAWIGNWYSVSEGKPNVPGMLGEVAFSSWGGQTFFDVSAIVNPNDNDGVKEMFPLNSNTPLSGCQTFPCSNAYNAPDDIATQATSSSELVCLLGTLSKTKKRSMASRLPREFVTGTLA